MPQYQPPSAIEELKAWIAAVSPVPRMLWTQETGALMDALAPLDLTMPFETIAARVGQSHDDIIGVIRKCPVELGPGKPT